MRIALIPGSFDPITLGHVNIIMRASKIFDKVYVAVMNNDSAKYAKTLSSKTYMFDMETRLELVKRSLSHLDNVETVSYSGMLIDLFDMTGADTVVKGIRNGDDLAYEMIHARWNKEHNPRRETLFLPADESLASLSSTRVRELIDMGEYEPLAAVLSPAAIKYLIEYKI